MSLNKTCTNCSLLPCIFCCHQVQTTGLNFCEAHETNCLKKWTKVTTCHINPVHINCSLEAPQMNDQFFQFAYCWRFHKIKKTLGFNWQSLCQPTSKDVQLWWMSADFYSSVAYNFQNGNILISILPKFVSMKRTSSNLQTPQRT